MGEKIKNLASLSNIIDVELNKATYEGGPRYIHLQNPNFRFCVTEKEFLEMTIALKKAIKYFKHYKGME